MKTDSLKKVYEKIKGDKKLLLIVLLGLTGCFLLGTTQMFSSSENTYSQTDIQWLDLEEKTADRLGKQICSAFDSGEGQQVAADKQKYCHWV